MSDGSEKLIVTKYNKDRVDDCFFEENFGTERRLNDSIKESKE